jgi:hypothetical protein
LDFVPAAGFPSEVLALLLPSCPSSKVSETRFGPVFFAFFFALSFSYFTSSNKRAAAQYVPFLQSEKINEMSEDRNVKIEKAEIH